LSLIERENEMQSTFTELKAKYNKLKDQKPELRIRNAAEILGVSEVELLACQMGDGVLRLNNKPEEILAEIHLLGEVMALTRNQSCVHERKGIYNNAQFYTHGKMKTGLFVNPDIDLRLFMMHWAHCFAVSENTKTGPRKSIQFFDKSGTAIHKIYMTNKSIDDAYVALVENFKSDDQISPPEIEQYAAAQSDQPDTEIDWAGFRSSWENLKDTHAFFPMLKKYGVGREQGFRKIGEDFAYEVPLTSVRDVMEAARDKDCEIMVFVGNRGCIQIHTGTVKKLVDFDNWYNVLDPMFNLHLNEDDIARVWVTKKPTEDGIVTAVELFDKHGEIIATLFGKRKPGDPELELWREIVNSLPAKKLSDAA